MSETFVCTFLFNIVQNIKGIAKYKSSTSSGNPISSCTEFWTDFSVRRSFSATTLKWMESKLKSIWQIFVGAKRGFLLDVQFQRVLRTLGPLSRDVQVARMHHRRFDVIFVVTNYARTAIFLFYVVRHA